MTEDEEDRNLDMNIIIEAVELLREFPYDRHLRIDQLWEIENAARRVKQ